MNIFVTDYNPKMCALDHCFVHRNKMIVEYAQLMSTAHHVWGTWQKGMYKPTHTNHPSAKWARASKANYSWLFTLWQELNLLYVARNGVYHNSYKLYDLLCCVPIEGAVFNKDMCAMPDEYKLSSSDVARCYQAYLNSKFTEWRHRDKPIKANFAVAPRWLEIN